MQDASLSQYPFQVLSSSRYRENRSTSYRPVASKRMNWQMIKISIFAIAAGLFAVLYCGVSAYSLVTPIMSIIVGQAAHSFGVQKKTINTLIVLIVSAFLIVLPYLESHPVVLKKVMNSLGSGISNGLKNPIKKSTDKGGDSRKAKSKKN